MTFHTPMLATPLFNRADSYTLAGFEDCIFGPRVGVLEEPVGYSREFISEGEAKGRLCGGNLTIIASSLGTPYEIDTKGKIIFMEDVGEELYRIDRMLNQLRLAGKFKDCAGLIFGDFGEMEGAQDLAALVRELNPSVPVLYNFRCGHCIPTASLPLGAMARLNSYKNLLEII